MLQFICEIRKALLNPIKVTRESQGLSPRCGVQLCRLWVQVRAPCWQHLEQSPPLPETVSGLPPELGTNGRGSNVGLTEPFFLPLWCCGEAEMSYGQLFSWAFLRVASWLGHSPNVSVEPFPIKVSLSLSLKI